jgi:hypothetical protein
VQRETDKLSALQKDILLCLLPWHEWMRENAGRLGRMALQGVPVAIIRHKGVSRADSAAFSRALRRLETRGLVIRTNVRTGSPVGDEEYGPVRLQLDEPVPKRTDHIILTPAGEEIAKRST